MRCNAELRALSSFADNSLERERENERELFALLSLSFCCCVVVSVVCLFRWSSVCDWGNFPGYTHLKDYPPECKLIFKYYFLTHASP